MASKSWDQVVGELGVWKRNGERAVHKPLLLLFLLGRAQRGQPPRLPFSEIEEPLRDALLDLGPPRKAVHPEYPFWHLQGDGIWSVTPAGRGGSLTRPGTPSAAALRDQAAAGELDAGLWAALTKDTALLSRVAQTLLDQFWPESYHDAVLARVGLDLAAGTSPAAPAAGQGSSSPRDPAFRQAVLRAYEGRCAVCGYDARLGNVSFGLEAAHIKFHCEGGPCEVPNGLALCALHHAAL